MVRSHGCFPGGQNAAVPGVALCCIVQHFIFIVLHIIFIEIRGESMTDFLGLIQLY